MVTEPQFGNWELQVGITPGQGGGLVLGLPVGPRDHDRPRCGGRGFLGFSGSRRGHGRASRGGDGRGYQGPGCGRGGRTKRSRRGGDSGDRGGAQSQRLWDGGTIKVAGLAEAGGCRAAEATEVAKRTGARGCCAAGAA